MKLLLHQKETGGETKTLLHDEISIVECEGAEQGG